MHEELEWRGSDMGIDSIKRMDNLSGRPMAKAQPADSVIKGIEDEISEIQRQRQKLSSKEELPISEKAKKRQELQQKISDLNRELRQRQVEIRKEQQKSTLAKENRTGISAAKEADAKAAQTRDITAKAAAGQNPKAHTPGSNGIDTDAAKADNARTNTLNAIESRKNILKENNAKTNATKTNIVKTDIATVDAAERTGAQNSSPHSTAASAATAGGKTYRDKALEEQAAQEKKAQLENIDIPEKMKKDIVRSDAAREQMQKQETVIARIEGGIAILKSEIRLDEARGGDTEKKQDELERQTDKLQKAAAAQFPSPTPFRQPSEKTAPAKTGTPVNFSKVNEQTAQPPHIFAATSIHFAME